jgi:hypothetical protein
MANTSNDRNRSILKTRPGDNNRTWILSAFAILALIGVLFWSFSGDDSNTVGADGDTSTGSASRPAPAPTPPASRQ